MPNQCDGTGVSTDCTGQPNPNGNCPEGATCFQGNCVTPCGDGEFPCPGGFVCDRTQTPALCVPDACAKASCPTGDICSVGSDGKAQCVDPCDNVSCPSGFLLPGRRLRRRQLPHLWLRRRRDLHRQPGHVRG